MTHHQKVITIDGPTASGKGTIAHLVAQHLDWHVLDSGALYRLAALHYYVETYSDIQSYLEQKIIDSSIIDESVITPYLKNWEHATSDEMEQLCQLAKNLPCFFTEEEIFLNKKPVSQWIRLGTISEQASQIASISDLRKALLDRQRLFLKESIEDHQKGLVADGRDMGTIVFPVANTKIYLTASSEVRAKRRTLQYLKLTQEQAISQGIHIESEPFYHEILEQLNLRDFRDMNREVAPLRPADDAIIIDSSHQTIEQIVQQIITHFSNSIE
jgi:cytidylate kinase